MCFWFLMVMLLQMELTLGKEEEIWSLWSMRLAVTPPENTIDDWPHEEVKEEANKYVGCLGHGNEPCRSETLFVILILA
jgi:hypothetical protein